MASLPDTSPRPFSVAEHHRVVHAGILTEDDRELRSSVVEGVALVVGDLFA